MGYHEIFTKAFNKIIESEDSGDKQINLVAFDFKTIIYPKDAAFMMYATRAERERVQEVIIEEGTTEIENGALANCTSLKAIKIPNSVTSIGDFAFVGCESLTNIEIPSSVMFIGVGAFAGCESLRSIKIPNSVTSIRGFAFIECGGLTIYCEAKRKPGGWHKHWCRRKHEWYYRDSPNEHELHPVVWGYTGDLKESYNEVDGTSQQYIKKKMISKSGREYSKDILITTPRNELATKIYNVLIKNGYDVEVDGDRFDPQSNNSASFTLSPEKNNGLFLQFRLYNDNYLQIREIEVTPEMQGKGLAGRVLDLIIPLMPKNSQIESHVNLNNTFWKRIKQKYNNYRWIGVSESKVNLKESYSENWKRTLEQLIIENFGRSSEPTQRSFLIPSGYFISTPKMQNRLGKFMDGPHYQIDTWIKDLFYGYFQRYYAKEYNFSELEKEQVRKKFNITEEALQEVFDNIDWEIVGQQQGGSPLLENELGYIRLNGGVADEFYLVIPAKDTGRRPTMRQYEKLFDWLDKFFTPLTYSSLGRFLGIQDSFGWEYEGYDPRKFLSENIIDTIQDYYRTGILYDPAQKLEESVGDTRLRKFWFAKISRDNERFPAYSQYYDSELGGYLFIWYYLYNSFTHESTDEEFSHMNMKKQLPHEMQQVLTYGEGSCWGREDYYDGKIGLFISPGASEKDIKIIRKIFNK